MNTNDPSGSELTSENPGTPQTSLIFTGVVCWALVSFGCYGLKILMQERPEFVGQPLRVTKAELVQEAPKIVVRKLSDDISAIKPVQPEDSDVRFDLNGRRDYRGLRTIIDMSGGFQGRYLLTNQFDEPMFVLFKCPHPHTESGESQSLQAGELRLRASAPGVQENSKEAWFWSGVIDQHSSASIDVSYQVASLKGVSYKV